MKPTTVRGIMRPALQIDSIETLGEAYRLMHANATRHLAVMHDGVLVGLLSERDVLEHRAALGFAEPWRDHGVSGAMSRAPRAVRPDAPVHEAAGRLALQKIGALPVIDGTALVGIVTVADVLGAEVPPGEKLSPRSLTAADAMTPGPFTTRAGETLLEATRRMRVHGIRHLPVVDAHDHVVGILSERDVRTAVGDPERFVLAGARTALRVADAMTRTPTTVVEERSITDVARLFEAGAIGAVPVVDHSGKLVGIVSYVDALHTLAAGAPG